MIQNFHPQTVFKAQVDSEAELEWALNDTTTPSIDGDIHYPINNLPKDKQTRRTAFYAFIRELKP